MPAYIKLQEGTRVLQRFTKRGWTADITVKAGVIIPRFM